MYDMNFTRDPTMSSYGNFFVPGPFPNNFIFPTDDEMQNYFYSNFLQMGPDSFPAMDPGFLEVFDEAMKNAPNDFRQLLSEPYEYVLPTDLEFPTYKPLTPVTTGSQEKIGTLSVAERAEKLKKFREKRKHRNYKKKISYLCRKKVADNRLRIKGRFVKKEITVNNT